MKKIKNLTFSTIRVMIKNSEIRINPRESVIIDSLNEDILGLEKKGLLKVRNLR